MEWTTRQVPVWTAVQPNEELASPPADQSAWDDSTYPTPTCLRHGSRLRRLRHTLYNLLVYDTRYFVIIIFHTAETAKTEDSHRLRNNQSATVKEIIKTMGNTICPCSETVPFMSIILKTNT